MRNDRSGYARDGGCLRKDRRVIFDFSILSFSPAVMIPVGFSSFSLIQTLTFLTDSTVITIPLF